MLMSVTTPDVVLYRPGQPFPGRPEYFRVEMSTSADGPWEEIPGSYCWASALPPTPSEVHSGARAGVPQERG